MGNCARFTVAVLTLVWLLPAAAQDTDTGTCPETLNFTKRTLAGEESVNLCRTYLGKVIIIVNTASKCGFTPQYEGLEALYSKYRDQGLVVLGFPSNDFGGQEPGTEKQIQDFCRLTYGVKFPMFEKTHAAKHHADPIFQVLGTQAGEFPSWNFHKYIIDRQGRLVANFPSRTEPQDSRIIQTLEALL